MNAEEFLKSKGHKHQYYSPPAYIARMMEEYHNYLSEQPDHTEPPLELRICTRCGKEFKSNVDCPICPSCYL